MAKRKPDRDRDRVNTWDANQAVDVLIGRGGAAVWVSRSELAPRAAIRHGSSDVVQTCMDLAALRIGLRRIEESASHVCGVGHDQLDRMIADAVSILDSKMETATRIMPSKEPS